MKVEKTDKIAKAENENRETDAGGLRGQLIPTGLLEIYPDGGLSPEKAVKVSPSYSQAAKHLFIDITNLLKSTWIEKSRSVGQGQSSLVKVSQGSLNWLGGRFGIPTGLVGI